ncbi:hypothetical protein WICMUC_003933 [Wickerhamomyces mucosus]|uniref:Serine hydrolase domain-containing protein n=1 Tax=Wickerhamomyces mucosus TaxID=1378264 RepID=A0A9P8TC56_9ASCO|nr:hypothetical protein WICMUC_003933 [Wickerhamomyces mucosus]
MSKVLCLHGFLQNGKIFSEKSSGLRKLLKKSNIQLDYIDGPIELTRNDLPFIIDDDSKWNEIVQSNINKAWFYHSDNSNELNIDLALETVFNYISLNGPYDGIIGFSQGAAISCIIANTINSKLSKHGNFKFALHVSGYSFTDKDSQNLEININENFKDLFQIDKDYQTKTLFIYGENDNSVPMNRSKYLANLYPNSIKLEYKHDGGHFIPNKKEFLRPIVEEIESSLK